MDPQDQVFGLPQHQTLTKNILAGFQGTMEWVPEGVTDSATAASCMCPMHSVCLVPCTAPQSSMVVHLTGAHVPGLLSGERPSGTAVSLHEGATAVRQEALP